jgi:hypothetical protein
MKTNVRLYYALENYIVAQSGHVKGLLTMETFHVMDSFARVN